MASFKVFESSLKSSVQSTIRLASVARYSPVAQFLLLTTIVYKIRIPHVLKAFLRITGLGLDQYKKYDPKVSYKFYSD